MKVKGSSVAVSAENYARIVGDAVAAHLAAVLEQADPTAELPAPSEFAAALDALLPYIPNSDPNELAVSLGPFCLDRGFERCSVSQRARRWRLAGGTDQY